MRICLDARSLGRQMTGLGRYAAHLVYHLTQLDPKNEYVVLRRPSPRGPIAVGKRVREVVLPYDLSTVRNAIRGARVVDELAPDLYHALFHFLPLRLRTRPRVVTLHDLIWVDHARLADGRRWRRWVKGTVGAWGVYHAVRSADHVIAISDSTRRAAISAWGLPDTKFTTIHHGVDRFPGVRSPSEMTGSRAQGFILALGNALPYKNMPRLIRGFSSISEEFPQVHLVLAGRGETYRDLGRLVDRLGMSGRVEFRERPSDREVEMLLADALLFAFPSLVEGFGMPMLEAMANGCPVLTSQSSSLPEVAGDAAILVDPLDADSIGAGMRLLLRDGLLRRCLSERGRRRARAFTWEACARSTLDVYERLTGAFSETGSQRERGGGAVSPQLAVKGASP